MSSGSSELADELGRDPDSVRAEAAGYLREMAASLDERAVKAWRSFSCWLMRAYDVLVDEDQIAQLRKLDRKATLAFAFSHRSYLDGMLLPEVIQANRLSPALTFGGANLNFFPMGAWAKRTGTIFIRRQTKDIPVYRFVLRAYAAQLVQNHANLTWSIEGGRTRTGKLRPPVFGILRYISDAVDEIDGPEVYLVPTSIVYDQLHEVEAMTTEAYGATKRPEDFRFLIRLARQQGERLGRAYLDFGEPLPLRKRLEELRAEESGTGTEIERIALDVEHRINRATPGHAHRGGEPRAAGCGPLAVHQRGAGHRAAAGELHRGAQLDGGRCRGPDESLHHPMDPAPAGRLRRRQRVRRGHRTGLGHRRRTSTWSRRSTATPPSTSWSTAPSPRRRCWPLRKSFGGRVGVTGMQCATRR